MASGNSSSLTSHFPQRKSGRVTATGDGKQKGSHNPSFCNTNPGFSSSKAAFGPTKSESASLPLCTGMDLDGEYDDLEETLCQFDMDMRYGPCLGIGRLDRWERAYKMGLHPPKQVREILERVSGAPACLWDTRV